MSDEQKPRAVALSTAAPALSLPAIQSLVSEKYGIEGTVLPLASERDQNCCIEQADGTRYVLKISNPSEALSIVDFQIAALNHIAEAVHTARRTNARGLPA